MAPCLPVHCKEHRGRRTSERLLWELWFDSNDNKANVHKLRNMIMEPYYTAKSSFYLEQEIILHATQSKSN